jgi:cytochrome c551/c552
MRNLRKDAKIGALVLVAALIASQAIRITKSNPPVQADVSAAPEISVLLHRACYNCHSNETTWPWYSDIAPVSWLVGSDVSEGRQVLNFSDWGTYSLDTKAKKLKKIAEEVVEGGMPPWYYKIAHPEARLSQSERDRIRNWSTSQLARQESK